MSAQCCLIQLQIACSALWASTSATRCTVDLASRVQTARLPGVFSAEHVASSGKAEQSKCQASELLSLFNVLAQFTARPFRLCVTSWHYLLSTAAKGHADTSVLQDSVHVFLKRHADAWRLDSLTPQTLWLLHNWDHLRRHQTLLSCFVLERQHCKRKRYVTDIANQRTPDQGVIGEVTYHALTLIGNPPAFNFKVGLVRTRPASWHLLAVLDLACDVNALIATKSRFNQWEWVLQTRECHADHNGIHVDADCQRVDNGVAGWEAPVKNRWQHRVDPGHRHFLTQSWAREEIVEVANSLKSKKTTTQPPPSLAS